MEVSTAVMPEQVPAIVNPPGRWRSLDCAQNRHYERCEERSCGCRCHEEPEAT